MYVYWSMATLGILPEMQTDLATCRLRPCIRHQHPDLVKPSVNLRSNPLAPPLEDCPFPGPLPEHLEAGGLGLLGKHGRAALDAAFEAPVDGGELVDNGLEGILDRGTAGEPGKPSNNRSITNHAGSI